MASIERRVEELERRQRAREGWFVVFAHDPPTPEEALKIADAERIGWTVVRLRWDDQELL